MYNIYFIFVSLHTQPTFMDKPQKPKKTAPVIVMVTEETKGKLTTLAKMCRRELPDYMRLAIDHLINENFIPV